MTRGLRPFEMSLLRLPDGLAAAISTRISSASRHFAEFNIAQPKQFACGGDATGDHRLSHHVRFVVDAVAFSSKTVQRLGAPRVAT